MDKSPLARPRVARMMIPFDDGDHVITASGSRGTLDYPQHYTGYTLWRVELYSGEHIWCDERSMLHSDTGLPEGMRNGG